MNAAAAATNQLSYKQLQAALKSYKDQGLTGIKLNSKQEVLQEEYERITTAAAVLQDEDEDELDSELTAIAIDNGYCELTCELPVPVNSNSKLAPTSNFKPLTYPFCSNTVKVVNQPAVEETKAVNATKDERRVASDQLFTIKVIPAMDKKYAPSWLCKPYTVYVIDGVDYLPGELEAQLKGQVCQLPAVVNERKLAANLPPRLQQPARKDRVSKARPAAPIVNVSKELPKAKLTFKAQEDYSPYFIDTHHSRFTKSLGDVEKQAARNLEDAISATKQGLKNVIDFAKGFHARQVERARKVAA